MPVLMEGDALSFDFAGRIAGRDSACFAQDDNYLEGGQACLSRRCGGLGFWFRGFQQVPGFEVAFVFVLSLVGGMRV
jgi:hypothetical protein